MKNKILFNVISGLIFSGLILIAGCKNNPITSSDCDPSQRTGAVCKDGTTSSATGSGACSHHGGVERWICR